LRRRASRVKNIALKKSWNSIAQAMRECTARWHTEWQASAPPYGTTAPADLEAACDDWCRLLEVDLRGDIIPPERVRPWILLRTVLAAIRAERHHENGLPPPGPGAIQTLLIQDWHAEHLASWLRVGLLFPRDPDQSRHVPAYTIQKTLAIITTMYVG